MPVAAAPLPFLQEFAYGGWLLKQSLGRTEGREKGVIPAVGVVLKIEWLTDGTWWLAAVDRIMGK